MAEINSNPYGLAQYIVPIPDQNVKFNSFDANPVLQQLPDHLLRFIGEFVSSIDQLDKLMKDYPHPNGFYQRLAAEADNFCPGRTMSDLLLKHDIVCRMYMAFTQALAKKATEILKGPSSKALIIELILQSLKR